MTRADPSTYYTPPHILALCEPQAGSGMFLAEFAANPLPIGARVLIDCDGGPVPCEVIEHDALRGMVRLRMVLPGQKRDGLCFWRPADVPVLDPPPSAADPIQPTGREDGDSPTRGNGSAAEAAGLHGHPSPDLVCASGSRAGVPVAGARPVAGAVGR